MKLITTVSIGDLVNLLLVAVLVGTTVFYAVRTHNLWQETRKTRLYQQPCVKLAVGRHRAPSVAIVNAGGGYALDLKLSLQQNGTPNARLTLGIPSLAPGASYDVPIQSSRSFLGWQEIGQNNLVVSIEGSCRDSVGEAINVSHRISLTEHVRQLEKIGAGYLEYADSSRSIHEAMILQRDREQYEARILDVLDKIARGLGR